MKASRRTRGRSRLSGRFNSCEDENTHSSIVIEAHRRERQVPVDAGDGGTQ